MNKKLTFTGGEPDLNFDDILRDPVANRAAIFGIVQGLAGSNDVKVSGADVTVNALVDASVTAGYIWLNGEVLQVEAATVSETLGTGLWEFQKEVTYDSAGDKTFNDATPRQTWQKNRAILVNVATITGMDADNARELVYNPTGVEPTAISGNISIAAGASEVGQYGRVVSGYVRFTVDSTLAGGVVDLVQIPTAIDPPSATVFSVVAHPSYDADPGATFASPKRLRITTGGVMQAYIGSGLQVGVSYIVQFSYVV